jgi:pyridoxal phosphate enzyme (YggS family)
MTKLEENYRKISHQIKSKLESIGRPANSVKLLAVSKGQPVESIAKLVRLGQTDFGENYVQEWKKKKNLILHNPSPLTPHPSPIHWHFTGRLQTNKVKELAGEITLFHSIDRWPLAEKIDQVAKDRGMICEGMVEVDLAHEKTKAGAPEEKLEEFLSQLNSFENLKITGLMILPPLADDPEQSRPYFKRLREILFDLNRKNIYKTPLTELSMGMSNDFLVAVEEGATWVRVGRAIFE